MTVKIIAASVLALSLSACVVTAPNSNSQQPSTSGAAPSTTGNQEVAGLNGWKGTISGNPAAGSRFSKLQIGMSIAEVYSILGRPTYQNSHVTGKAWIPFYYGAGRYEIVAYYQGQGRLIFSSEGGFTTGGNLIIIQNDPSERGYP